MQGAKAISVEVELKIDNHNRPNQFQKANGQPPTIDQIYCSLFRLHILYARSIMLTDYPPDLYQEIGAAFFRNNRYLDKHSPTLRLKRSLDDLVDFQRTSYSGAMGQAIGLLWMEAMGYIWATHFENCTIETKPMAAKEGGTKKGVARSPDFVVANQYEVALLECKGSLSTKVARAKEVFWSSTVGANHKEQVWPWLGSEIKDGPATVVINKGYSCGTFMQVGEDASLLTICTDNPGSSPANANIIPGILRSHYERWFKLMGLWPQAYGLRNRTPVSDILLFQRASINNIDYLFPITSISSSTEVKASTTGLVAVEGVNIKSVDSNVNINVYQTMNVPLPPPIWWQGRQVLLGLEEIAMRLVLRMARSPTDNGRWIQEVDTFTPGAITTNGLDLADNLALFQDGAVALTSDVFPRFATNEIVRIPSNESE